MNVSILTSLLPPSLTGTRSSRNPGYDSGESRRSPRSRSPGRYSEFRDEYRGGSTRGSERRRSIDSTSRPNFATGRDNFRDSTARDSARDFPSREPPRGPKALIDGPSSGPPSGPRANSYAGDFRGDFGYRGDFRGSRGRPRGRGGWRDDSRDRVREPERDYRSPRDDRAPPFRDDRGRDRDRWERNESFRGRRPSPPPGRGRSPNYSNREPSRDVPPSQDVDRLARRGSRDGPLSIGSPASDAPPPFRSGYGRGRGIRGRGRGAYYDDFHSRNPSPDPNWNRRTQPSATPPPQVPAFGSTSTSISLTPSNLKPPVTPTPPTGPANSLVMGVPVPTAPRSHGSKFMRDINKAKWSNSEPTSPRRTVSEVAKPSFAPNKPSVSDVTKPPESPLDRPNDTGVESMPNARSPEEISSRDKVTATEPLSGSTQPAQNERRKRRLIYGRRPTVIPSKESAEPLENASDDSDADSVDSISRAEFLEGDLKQAEKEWSNIPVPLEEDDAPIPDEILQLYDAVENDQDTNDGREEKHTFVEGLRKELYDEKLVALHPLQPAADLDAFLLTPYMESSLGDPESIFFKARQTVAEPFNEKECVPTEGQPDEDLAMDQETLKNEDQELIESEAMAVPFANGKNVVSRLEAQVSGLETPLGYEPSTYGPQMFSGRRSSANADEISRPSSRPVSNGRPTRTKPMMDQFDKSEDELSGAEREEEYAAVRKMMETPLQSSLPDFKCKKWDQDSDFLISLEPDPVVEGHILKTRAESQARREREQEEERHAWKQRYHQYRRWTDFSDDPVAVRSRDRFAKSRAKAAAEAAELAASTPAAGSRPEPQRRTGSRWATDHDLERILQESKQEAKESQDKEKEKEKEERDARAKTASDKEAAIPDMYWDEEERLEYCFIDRTHLVPFERSFARLEFGEPIDNFEEEECEIFEKVYLETPKQWGKIAEALSQRDYKACIQHYYLVKHSSNLKDKFKKQGRKKGRKAAVPKGAKPKSNALTVDIVKGDDTEDGQDTENGSERRRPRRAAAPTFAFEATPSDVEAQSSGTTPGRKPAAAGSKGDGSSEAAPPKRKPKVPREKGSKQAKNSQLLAAAPTPSSRESPAAQPVPSRLEPIGQNRFPLQYDGATVVAPSFVPSPYPPGDKPNPSMTVDFDSMAQPPFAGQDRLDSATPMAFDGQDRRNLQQTSSYWSVPEQTDFPALLRHFGTDWHGIAKFMTSKTHIMVKNYYLRQVDSGRMSSWRDIAEEADEKRQRGEPTGPLPKQTVIPKRRIEGQATSTMRPGSAMEGLDDLSSTSQTMVLQQGSPPQPSLSSRFPALAQAGPVPQSLNAPAAPASILSKHLPPQSAQQMQQSRAPRGPALGYFNTDSQRPIMQAVTAQGQSTPPLSDSISQRSLMVAQEAHLERQQALRLEREQAAQAQAHAQAHQAMQQQQAIQLERQLHMKQETDMMNVHQYEQYSSASMQPNAPASSRSDAPNPVIPRTAPPQQYQPRVRSIVGEGASIGRELKSSPSPAIPRGPMSAPPASQEQYAPPPPPQAPSAPSRPEPARKSNIMSLLNDEPADRGPPPKRVSDVTSTTLQRSQTPPPQHSLQSSRYTGHPPPASTQPLSQISQQLPSQMAAQHQPPQSQHAYTQSSGYTAHQQPSSTGPSRSYTPSTFDSRPYPPQSLYSQSSRQSLSAQPSRREPSLSEHHSGGYSHGSTSSQSSMRIQDVSYSATPPPGQQTTRQQATSPLDHPQPSDRDYYSRQSYQMQQQPSGVRSPQLGPTYHTQSQQQPSHRSMAFGGASHMASPTPQYATQHPLHRSRRNSFDGRYPGAATSPPAPHQQGYVQAPQHQVTPLSSQYQQPHSGQDRFESGYERDRRLQEERDRRLQDEAYHQRRLDESRR